METMRTGPSPKLLFNLLNSCRLLCLTTSRMLLGDFSPKRRNNFLAARFPKAGEKIALIASKSSIYVLFFLEHKVSINIPNAGKSDWTA